jgi:hypothetical protein
LQPIVIEVFEKLAVEKQGRAAGAPAARAGGALRRGRRPR